MVDPEAKLEERVGGASRVGRSSGIRTEVDSITPRLADPYQPMGQCGALEMRRAFVLRTAEFLWQEGHTCSRYVAEAVAETRQMLDVYGVCRDIHGDAGHQGAER